MEMQHDGEILKNALSKSPDTVVIGDMNKPDVQVMAQELQEEGVKVVSKQDFDLLNAH